MMTRGSSQQASAIHRLATLMWRSESSSSRFSSSSLAANPTGLRGYASSAAKEEDVTSDEFWVVEGEILRVRGGIEKNKLKMKVRDPPSENLNLSRKKVAKIRYDRVVATRVAKSERGQEEYWKLYFQKYQSVRDQWEKLYYDEVPQVVKTVPATVNKNDPYTILGLKRREKPYSPVELKSAYREMALKYHPDHNPGKDAEVRFEKIWNAYKMLQHKRSWR